MWRIALGVFLGMCAFGIVTGILSAIVARAQIAEANQAIENMVKTWPKPQYAQPQYTPAPKSQPQFSAPQPTQIRKFQDQLTPNERCINHQVLQQINGAWQEESNVRC